MNEAKLDLQGHMLDDVGYVPEYTLQRSAHTRDVGGVRSMAQNAQRRRREATRGRTATRARKSCRVACNRIGGGASRRFVQQSLARLEGAI